MKSEEPCEGMRANCVVRLPQLERASKAARGFNTRRGRRVARVPVAVRWHGADTGETPNTQRSTTALPCHFTPSAERLEPASENSAAVSTPNGYNMVY